MGRQERNQRIAQGADPGSVILQSELRNHIPQRNGESPTDYVQRYVETMNAMLNRGVTILNDQTTADVKASGFGTEDGRFFELGPGSGATKGEFREFGQCFSEYTHGTKMCEVPDKWKKFEKPAKEL